MNVPVNTRTGRPPDFVRAFLQELQPAMVSNFFEKKVFGFGGIKSKGGKKTTLSFNDTSGEERLQTW
jgi:hypothetical protein